ncbi:iron-sulfur cluster assembly scaffold protein [Arenimonas aestuarii]
MTTPSPEPANAAAALYRQQVLDHGRQPRQSGRLDGRARRAQASNTLCGDRVAVSLRLDPQGRISELRHDSQACLLCLASASLMTQHVAGLDAAGVARHHEMLRAGIQDASGAGASGDLAALAGVAPYPSRHRCVLLPWEALRDALEAPETEPSP